MRRSKYFPSERIFFENKNPKKTMKKSFQFREVGPRRENNEEILRK